MLNDSRLSSLCVFEVSFTCLSLFSIVLLNKSLLSQLKGFSYEILPVFSLNNEFVDEMLTNNDFI